MRDFYKLRYAQKETQYIALASFTTFLVIYLLGYITETSQLHVLLAPLGPSCILVFGFHGLPVARIRNLIGSYALAILISVILPQTLWGMALAVALTLFFMIKLNFIHPPSAGMPIVIYYMDPAMIENFLVNITAGILIISAVSIPFDHLVKRMLKHNPKHPETDK